MAFIVLRRRGEALRCVCVSAFVGWAKARERRAHAARVSKLLFTTWAALRLAHPTKRRMTKERDAERQQPSNPPPPLRGAAPTRGGSPRLSAFHRGSS